MIRLTRIAALLAAAAATAALAHQGVDDPQVLARMQHMERLAESTKTIGRMAKAEVAFDAQAANTALAAISTEARDIPDYFEDEADDPKSEARPEIWQDWQTFAALSEKLADAATQDIASEGDLRPALAEIGAACRACHETFRD